VSFRNIALFPLADDTVNDLFWRLGWKARRCTQGRHKNKCKRALSTDSLCTTATMQRCCLYYFFCRFWARSIVVNDRPSIVRIEMTICPSYGVRPKLSACSHSHTRDGRSLLRFECKGEKTAEYGDMVH
jgi:hypothetical protein